MSDDCMGCRHPGVYSHATYCPESIVKELRQRCADAEARAEAAERDAARRLELLLEAEPFIGWGSRPDGLIERINAEREGKR